MARKIIKTKIPKARQHGVRIHNYTPRTIRVDNGTRTDTPASVRTKEIPYRAALDLCKIDTGKLRRLSLRQLEVVRARIGANDKPEWHRQLWALVYSLINAKQRDSNEYTEFVMRTDGISRAEALRRAAQQRAFNAEEADRRERVFHEMQERAGCRLKPYELVARDAERAGRVREARIIRRDARRKVR